MSQELTNQDVHGIIYAIDVARGEMGEGFEDLEAKLLKLYPAVKKEIAKAKSDDEAETRRQARARLDIAGIVFNSLDASKPIEPQIQKYIKEKYDDLRAHYSDEICLSADLFKYHLPALEKIGLIKELRARLRKSDSDYDRSQAEGSAKELWHALARP